MGQAYRDVERIRQFIRQQEVSLIPNERNGELPQAYDHYITACSRVDPETLAPEDAARLVVAPRYAADRKDDVTALLADCSDAHGLDTPTGTTDDTLETVRDDIEAVADGQVEEQYPTLDTAQVRRWENLLYRRYVRRGIQLLDKDYSQ